MLMSTAVLGAAGIGAAGGLLNTYLQYQNYQYQQNLQKDIFAREDTSIQRRVKDLRRAGLSPVLAAGQGAGTGGIVSTNAPQTNAFDKAAEAMTLAKVEADIETTKAQKLLIASQRAQAISQTMKNLGEIDKIAADTNQSMANAAMKWNDYDYYSKRNMPSNAPTLTKQSHDVYDLFKYINNKSTPNSFKDALDPFKNPVIKKFLQNKLNGGTK